MTQPTDKLKSTLKPAEVHQTWGDAFLDPAIDAFYEEAFDRIANTLNPQRGTTILDAGCGLGRHTVRLAKRGFIVFGFDFAPSALGLARSYIEEHETQGSTRLSAADLLQIGARGAAFDHVISWGVLVHIPEVDKALSELVRVLKPGGRMVLIEVNKNSLESRLVRTYSGRSRRSSARVLPANERGIEYWTQTPKGELLSRHTDINWLNRRMDELGCSAVSRTATQFFQIYVKFRPGLVKQSIHRFNHLWFKHARMPGPSFGNLIVFEKR
jgi:ubiquinone/menaquinone biosynthesis C-methylase UbiE